MSTDLRPTRAPLAMNTIVDGLPADREPWLARLTHVIRRYRWVVIGAWMLLTVFGGFAAGQLSSRWFQSTSIPGKPAYETGQLALKAFGAGVRPPDVVVFSSTTGDVTKVPAVRAAMERVATANPGRATLVIA